jgi:protein-tyrosine phosphatase
MAAVLVVCTGNVCRSPVAEALVRSTMRARFGAAAPTVASAGIAGWAGSRADPRSVAAGSEVGVDLASHVARRLRRDDLADAELVIAMAHEHALAVAELEPVAADRTFALKELVRLLEAAPERPAVTDPSAALRERVRLAGALRSSGFAGNPYDDDVADPLGLPLEAFRAMTWELGEWVARLDVGLFGAAVPARAADRG